MDASVFYAADVAQPSQASLFEEGEHSGDALLFRALRCVLSLYEMTRVRFEQRMSKLLSLLTCRERIVQDWLPHRRVLTTQALYTCNFVRSTSLLFVQILFCRPGECGSCLPNAYVELGLNGEVVRDR